MIRFEEIIINDDKLFSNGNSLEVTNIITFENVEFPDITFNNNEIKVSTNTIEYGKNIGGKGIFDSHDLYFKNCSFSGKLEFNGLLNRYVRFDDCSFTDIILKDIQHDNEKATNGFSFIGIKSILSITVDFCEFNGKFYINKQDDDHNSEIILNKLIIKDTEFKNNFKLHNCRVKEIELKDTDFQKNADFYKSKFDKGLNTKEIYFKSMNFKSLALFGDTEFFEKLIFQYVTFEGYNHFKSAKLHKGLDLEYTNVQKEINFYGIEIEDTSTTSQETYRIIKNQFEKLGNKIEANKYHALELNQRKRELEKNKWQNFSEYLVFKIHDISSKHSTSWFRALMWIIFTGFLTIFLVHLEIVKDVFFHPYHFKIEYICKIWNEFWQYINITNLEKLKDKPFIFFLNKVSLGYLYYQFLTAVRKDTRK
ncbi:hypothetical protein KKG72_10900 [bacterium]|nr:hypothetical protein [bacterium]MBU1993521.1 hypothetical protein [bacterium]